jgi:hypothetical protein
MERSKRIKLLTSSGPAWRDKKRVETIFKTLISLGFDLVDVFTAKEIPNLQIAYFSNIVDRAIATIYESRERGIWIDFITYYEKGPTFNYTTAPEYTIRHSPNWIHRSFRRANVKRMYKKFLAERPENVMVVPTRDEIIRRAEEEYASEQSG